MADASDARTPADDPEISPEPPPAIRRGRLRSEPLEPRILFSVSWTDDVGGPLGGPTAGDDIGTGDGADDVIAALGGDDIIDAGGGDDTITWSVGDGFDTIDGGTGSDTLVLNGDGTSRSWLVEDADTHNARTGSSFTSGHVIVSVDGTVVADAVNVESLTINTGSAGDSVAFSGDFSGTDLGTDGILVVGGAGDDTIDGSGITSGHDVQVVGSDGADDLTAVTAADSVSPAALGAIGLWELDESSGTSLSDAIGGNDAVAVNGAIVGAPGVTGSGTGIEFDGSDDFVRIDHDPAYMLDEGSFSVWVDADSTSRGTLWSKDHIGDGQGGHFTATIVDGEVWLRLQSTSSDTILTGGSITAGEAHHVAATFGADGVRLYVDGVLVDQDASWTSGLGTSAGGTGNTEAIFLGADNMRGSSGSTTPSTWGSKGGHLDGTLDQFAIFDAQLDASDIAALAARGTAGGAGDDTITWVAGQDAMVVDGGTGTDTLVLQGDGTARTWLVEDADTHNARTGSTYTADRVIVSMDGVVVVEASDVESLRLEAGSAGDTITFAGDFTATDLDGDGLSVVGGTGDDVIDISGVTSAHEVDIVGNDGADDIVGQGPEGATATVLGAVGSWELDESSGTSLVDAVGGNSGVAVNGATVGAAGLNGSSASIDFDGTNDYVRIEHDPAYLVDEGAFAIWMNADDVNSGSLWSKDAQNYVDGGHFTAWIDNGTVEVRLQTDGASRTISGGTVTAGTDHFVAVTFGSEGLRLYVDGALVAQDAAWTSGLGVSSGGSGNTEAIYLGTDNMRGSSGGATPGPNNSGSYFDGRLDQFQIFDSQLDAADIAALASGAAVASGEIDTGAGDDTITWTVGDAPTTFDGGADDDTLVLRSDDAGRSWLVEDADTHNARTGAAYTSGHVVVSVDGVVVAETVNLESIEIQGSGSADTVTFSGDFSGTDLAAGGVTVSGGAASDLIDLSNWNLADATIADGSISVGGMQIEHADAEVVRFGDVDLLVADAATTLSGVTGTVNILAGSDVIGVTQSGGGPIDFVADASGGSLVISDVTGSDATTSIRIHSITGDPVSVGGIDLDSDVGTITVATDVAALSLTVANGTQVDLIAFEGDLSGTYDVTGDVGDITVGDDVAGSLSVTGHVESISMVDDLLVGGSISVGSLGDFTSGGDVRGDLLIAGDLGTATIGDDVEDSAMFSVGGDAGTIAVADDIKENATVRVTGAVGTLTVGATIDGNAQVLLGSVTTMTVGNDIDSIVTITGDVGSLSADDLLSDSVVTIGGDAGTIAIADDIAARSTLDVTGSVGTLTIGGDLRQDSTVSIGGDATAISVGADFRDGASLVVGGTVGTLDLDDAVDVGTTLTLGSVTTFTVGNDIRSDVTITGDLGSLTIGDDLTDGARLSVGGDAGTITIIDDLKESASLQVGGTIARLDIQSSANGGGSVSAGAIDDFTVGGDLGVDVTIDGGLGTLTVGDDLTDGAVLSVGGDAGTISITDNLWNDARIDVTGAIGSLDIGTDIADGSSVTAGAVASFVVGADLYGDVTIAGDLGTVTIGDDLTGASTFSVGGDAGTISIADDIWNDARIVVAGGIDTLDIGNRIVDGSSVQAGAIQALSVGTDVLGSVTVAGALGSASVGGDVSADLAFGSVGTLDVTGALTADLAIASDAGTLGFGTSIGVTITIGGDLDRFATGAFDGRLVAERIVGAFALSDGDFEYAANPVTWMRFVYTGGGDAGIDGEVLPTVAETMSDDTTDDPTKVTADDGSDEALAPIEAPVVASSAAATEDAGEGVPADREPAPFAWEAEDLALVAADGDEASDEDAEDPAVASIATAPTTGEAGEDAFEDVVGSTPATGLGAIVAPASSDDLTVVAEIGPAALEFTGAGDAAEGDAAARDADDATSATRGLAAIWLMLRGAVNPNRGEDQRKDAA